MGNIFAVAPDSKPGSVQVEDKEIADALSALDGKPTSDDAQLEVKESDSGQIIIDDDELIVVSEGSGLGPVIPGPEDGMFAAFDEAESKADESSSGSRSVDDMEKEAIAKELAKIGLPIPIETPKMSNRMWKDVGTLLIERKWLRDAGRNRYAMLTIFETALSDTPNRNAILKSSTQNLGKELISVLRKKGHANLADALDWSVSDLPDDLVSTPKGGTKKP